MKSGLIAVLLAFVVLSPIGANAFATPAQRAQGDNQAVVLSSVNKMNSMSQASNVINYLKQGGYNVTYLTDEAVTVDFLLNNLNNFSVVIWRTDTFNWVHTTYWYVGEKSNSRTDQKYAAEISAGLLSSKGGLYGVSANFLTNHFGANTLSRLKLLVLMANNANVISTIFLTAGATSVIFCIGSVSLQFGLADTIAVHIISHLVGGANVHDALYNALALFDSQNGHNLEATVSLPYWFIGSGTLTID